jgi:acyl-CoA thioesterase-1
MEGLLKLKRRHFNALTVAALTLGTCGRALAQNAATPATASGPVILVVGDSLSSEYGLQRGRGWVALMDERLRQEKLSARAVNASISGETTAGGLSRLPALLRQHTPAVVILELGGNDALRGLPLSTTRDNLSRMAKASKASGAKVLIVGMEMPPNYGARYAQEFREVFTTVAKNEQTALVPFLLKDVADIAEPTRLFQSDRIHPNEAAHPIMMANVWPEMRKLLPQR